MHSFRVQDVDSLLEKDFVRSLVETLCNITMGRIHATRL